MSFKYVNESEIDAAVADVRNDATETNWVLIAYDNTGQPSQLELRGSGSGGADELAQQLTDDTNCYYAMCRITEMIDNSLTVKFVFLKYLGLRCKPMFKAKLTTHIEQVQQKLRPFHVSLTASSLDEVSQAIFEKLVAEASMSKSREKSASEAQHMPSASRSVTAAAAHASAPAPATTSTGSQPAATLSAAGAAAPRRKLSNAAPGAPPASGAASGAATSAAGLVDMTTHGDEIRAALADVRNDATETNWALVTYEQGSNNRLALVGSGQGGAEELKQHLDDAKVMYGLVRVQEVIDASLTTKFAFIQWLGPRISPLFKAKVSTHKGPIEQLFTQFHVSLFCTELGEISDDIIQELVAKASGRYQWTK